MARRVPQDAQALARRLRDVGPWIWYDTVAVFQGARDQSTSWFNNFRDFANADQILFFRGNGRSVGLSYSDAPNDRLDFAFTIHGATLDFQAPLTTAKYNQDLTDIDIMPQVWLRELPRMMSFRVKISGVDELYISPGTKIPSGQGPISDNIGGLGFTTNNPGVNGLQTIQNMLTFPEPIEVPANQARIDEPIKSYLATLPGCPGLANWPTCPDPPIIGAPPPTYEMAMVYSMRWTWWGTRHVQLRGARSAAGAIVE